MNELQIYVENLTKVYRVPQREAGLRAAVRSLGRKVYTEIPAVRKISFRIEAGETVGFIGPNGAGKTTTLKMLAGLLHPTSGKAQVAGYTPWERKPDYLRRIAMVLGNKSQLMWDIPALDTFRVLGEIYHIPRQEQENTVSELVDLLGVEGLLSRPVRNLSLGERMKCELIAALLHRPAVLFLDEPTLGLDVSMQRRLRKFIGEYNLRHGATVILTSHYMADVIELCHRVILIHYGQVLYDGQLAALGARLAPFKLVRLTLKEPPNGGLPEAACVVEQENGKLTLRVRREETPALTAHLLSTLAVADLAVEDPPLEAVIDQIYHGGSGMNGRGGWALIQHTWLSWMQHRSFFCLLAFGWMVPPLIYLFVWSTAAGGGTVGGLTRGEFVAYYLILVLVNQLTYAQTNWTMGDLIRDGSLSRLLLYPISPLFNTLASELAGKVVYLTFVVPVTAALAVVLRPEIHVTMTNVPAFLLALGFAWLLRFFWGYWLALLAFWMTRADALLALQDALVFLLGGLVAPVALLPETLRTAAVWFPFRYMVGFPVEVLTGQLNAAELAAGFAVQGAWLAVALGLYQILWRRGVRHYTAVGG